MLQDKSEFYVRYDGPALSSNQMDVRELAPALLAIGKIIEEANNILNEGKTKVIVNVKAAFQKGSFGIELNVVQSFFANILDIFSTQRIVDGATVLAYLGFIGLDGKQITHSLLYVLNYIKGRKIHSIEKLQDDKIRLQFADDSLDITPAVLKLLESKIIRENIERAIKKPLKQEGFDCFMIDGNDIIINKNEADWYTCPPLQEEKLDEKTFIEKLQIVNLPFQDDNKWRFTDGNNIFFSSMQDEEFIQKINNNDIFFSKGDILEAQVYKKAWIDTEGKMKSEYQILKILSHRSAARQLRLL